MPEIKRFSVEAIDDDFEPIFPIDDDEAAPVIVKWGAGYETIWLYTDSDLHLGPDWFSHKKLAKKLDKLGMGGHIELRGDQLVTVL